ncbi:hypothetical protein [Zavarzinella formosa]|uniref:hypothetical protein n=1 Tax=Zavarzinella formosa TaxID=360055 RepID=UPI00031B05B0|nr:hypothetical protein [Zavarzinella formosa]
MFKIFQGTLIAASLGMAFSAGYEMRPAPKAAKPVTTTADLPPARELLENSPAVDIRLPVGEMTPLAEIPVDRKDIAFKWIEKELGINTTVLNPQEKQTLSVLQPLEPNPAPAVPSGSP